MAKSVKNISGSTKSWGGVSILDGSSYYCQSSSEAKMFFNDNIFVADISIGLAEVYVDGVLIVGASASLNILRVEEMSVNVLSTPPFSVPDYRTKRSATDLWVNCLENTSTAIDYILPEELYVSGGEIIFYNSKKGDYITAEVNDVNGVIPVLYRAALCESHPTVATYIVKKWIVPSTGFGSFMIDTYPLNAKITAGLSLRVTYFASAEAGTREVSINYHLTKKLA